MNVRNAGFIFKNIFFSNINTAVINYNILNKKRCKPRQNNYQAHFYQNVKFQKNENTPGYLCKCSM